MQNFSFFVAGILFPLATNIYAQVIYQEPLSATATPQQTFAKPSMAAEKVYVASKDLTYHDTRDSNDFYGKHCFYHEAHDHLHCYEADAKPSKWTLANKRYVDGST